MRSVVVVLPASMWAINPIFRTRSNGVVLAIVVYRFSFFVFRVYGRYLLAEL
jgi:hypothetical protein